MKKSIDTSVISTCIILAIALVTVFICGRLDIEARDNYMKAKGYQWSEEDSKYFKSWDKVELEREPHEKRR